MSSKLIQNVAFRKMSRFVRSIYTDLPNGAIRKTSIIHKYCDIIKVKIPNKKQIMKFALSEYERMGSPIFKQVVIPLTEKEKNKKKNKAKKLNYRKYLLSSAWRSFKNKLKKERGNNCEHCNNSKSPLDGHHITYERLFNELPEDVLLLCRTCHEKVHDRKIGK